MINSLMISLEIKENFVFSFLSYKKVHQLKSIIPCVIINVVEEVAVMLINKAYKFRLYPNNLQMTIINPLNIELLLKDMGSVFDYLGTSFLSNAITGKRILVTWNDVLGITYSTRNFDVQSFVDKSNSMLTMSSFEDWEDYISKDSRLEKREVLCKKYF